MSEAELQALLAEVAELAGWWRAHFRPARTVHGWRTPGQYEAGAGWPDLVLVRDCVLVWELKSGKGKVDPAQQAWLDAWAGAGVETAVVTPANLDDYAIPRLMRKAAA
jgi:VRR-NUC domain